MDESTRKKLDYQYELDVSKIVVDKIIIGLIVAGLALFGAHLLEDYKSDLTHKRFLAESRLSAIEEIREKYSGLSNFMMELANSSGKKPKEFYDTYKEHWKSFVITLNKKSALFPESLNDEFRPHVWIHEAVAFHYVEFNENHRAFAVNLFAHFDSVTRKAIWKEVFQTDLSAGFSGFPPVKWTNNKMAEPNSDSGVYFEENWKAWSAWYQD